MSDSDGNRKRNRKRKRDEETSICTSSCHMLAWRMPHSHAEMPTPTYKHVDAIKDDAVYTPEINKHVRILRNSLTRYLDVDSFLKIPTRRLRTEFPIGIPLRSLARILSSSKNGIGNMLLAWKDLLSRDVVLCLSGVDEFEVTDDNVCFKTSYDTAGKESVNVSIDSITRVVWNGFKSDLLNSLRNVELLTLIESAFVFVLPCLRRLAIKVDTEVSCINAIHVLSTHTLLQHICLDVSPVIFLANITSFVLCLSSLSVVDVEFHDDVDDHFYYDPIESSYRIKRGIDAWSDILVALLTGLQSVHTLRVRLHRYAKMTDSIYKLLSTHPTLTAVDLSIDWTSEFPLHYRVHDLFLMAYSDSDKWLELYNEDCEYNAHNQRVLADRRVWGGISVLISSTRSNEGSKFLDSVLDLIPAIIGFAGLDNIDTCVFAF